MVAIQSVRGNPSMPFWGMDYRQFLLIKAVAFDMAEIDFDGVHVKRK
jgi:hypothetical protein